MRDDFLPEDFEKEVAKSVDRLKLKWFLIGFAVGAITVASLIT